VVETAARARRVERARVAGRQLAVEGEPEDQIGVGDGVGAVVAPGGRLALVLTVVVGGTRVAGYEVIADPARLRDLDLALLP
jgi:hypothetical protein